MPCRLPNAASGIGLYLHVPFCLSKCPYCDFNTYEGLTPLIPAYMAALEREIRLWAELLHGPPVSSIYYGGGTPSYVPPHSIASSLQTVTNLFEVSRDAELTLEANPGDVAPEQIDSWMKAGINRLSIGVQSFDDALLKTLGRRHTSQEAARAALCAASRGLENLSLDLMFGLPLQTLGQWQNSLNTAIDLEPQHLSIYGLQLEPGTPMEADVRLGRTPDVDNDLAADMYTLAEDTLGQAGFEHYEISNWARRGKESQHNLAYWTLQPYLGVGSGAHSFLHGRRFANVKSPRAYARCLESDAAIHNNRAHPVDAMRALGTVGEAETMDRQTAIAETMMMGMRLSRGVSNADFNHRFGVDMSDVFYEELRDLSDAGLIIHDHAGARLTPRGRLLGNEVFARLVEASSKAAQFRPGQAA